MKIEHSEVPCNGLATGVENGIGRHTEKSVKK
jgi:hypothetical protein